MFFLFFFQRLFSLSLLSLPPSLIFLSNSQEETFIFLPTPTHTTREKQKQANMDQQQQRRERSRLMNLLMEDRLPFIHELSAESVRAERRVFEAERRSLQEILETRNDVFLSHDECDDLALVQLREAFFEDCIDRISRRLEQLLAVFD